MKGINNNIKCKLIRGWLSNAISKQFNPDAEWFQNHIAKCPRCQKRFLSYGKVDLAITAIKSQPHTLDLLMRANLQTINVLKHSLRRDKKAKNLKTLQPQPKLLEKYSRYSSSALNVAACMAILILMKIGVFSSMNTFQNQGQKVIEKYYVNRIGDDLAEDIFPNKQNTPVI